MLNGIGDGFLSDPKKCIHDTDRELARLTDYSRIPSSQKLEIAEIRALMNLNPRLRDKGVERGA
jgi:hypothetical protein